MIRVITLDEFDPKAIAKLCATLYQAFGVGCEHQGDGRMPDGLGDPIDSHKLLDNAPTVRAYPDDKLLYITSRKLKDRELPLKATAPTSGIARYSKDRALVTTHPKKNLEEAGKWMARHAMHQVGHLWELHHCLDPRCAMYPPWTPSYANGDSAFCTFCRDKSEQKIRLAKS
jgi:archaemetzincin